MKKTGFTLLELLIGIFILSLLSVLAVNGLARFKLMQIHNSEVSKVMSILDEARNRAQSGDNARNYSVTINTLDNTITLTRVTTEVGDTPYSSSKTLDPRTSASNISISGSVDTIVFTRFTGATNNSGTITITTSAGTNSKVSTVRIYPTGLAARE